MIRSRKRVRRVERGVAMGGVLIFLLLVLLVLINSIHRWKHKDFSDLYPGTYDAACTDVLSGDTLLVSIEDVGDVRIQLLGVDAMEIHDGRILRMQAARLGVPEQHVMEIGKDAAEMVRDQLLGQSVRIVVPRYLDEGGPTNAQRAYVEFLGADIGEWLLAEGMAMGSGKKHPRTSRYRIAARYYPARNAAGL